MKKTSLHKNKIMGACFLSIAASIWGGMFVVVKSVVAIIHPVELVWLRYLLAAVFLGLYLLFKKPHWHWNKRDLGCIFLIGLIGNTLSIVCQETGTFFSSAQMGAVITSATPAFIVIFAWLILKEKIAPADLIALLLATVGVIVIVGFHTGGRNIFIGIFMLIIAALTWALMSVLVRTVSRAFDAVQITFLAVLFSICLLTPYILSHWQFMRRINYLQLPIASALLYLGAISTALAFVLWNKGLQLYADSSAGLFFLFQPFVGTLLGWFFLGENIGWSFICGSLFIAASIWLTVRYD